MAQYIITPTPRQALFGKFVKTCRLNAGMTQKDVAVYIDVTATYISKIENGKYEVMPSVEVVGKLGELFNISRHMMLCEAGIYDKKALDNALSSRPSRAAILNELIAKWEAEDNG